MRRAVITGLGIVSSIGVNKQDVLASLKAGKSGITHSEQFAEMGLRSQVWGNIDIDLKEHIDRKAMRFMGDAAAYAYVAMQQAIEDSGLEDSDISNDRTGIIAGSGGASSENQVLSADILREKGVKRVGPYMVPRCMASTVSACLATPFKIRGGIGNAMELIQLGKQDVVFAGGGEELHWALSSQFDAMGALSSKYNDNPSVASRTYDAARDGFVSSGGGGMVVVEELEHALARGAKIYGEVVGYGATSDGFDMVAPSGEGAIRCMKMAMQNVSAPIDYLNTHGTSTPVGDVKELAAIQEVFGQSGVPISATKSLTGHALGAAGVNEAIYSLLMMENNFIAPSINIDTLDDAADGLDIVTQAREATLNTVMSNSFGFGGTNATLVMQRYQG